jgi:hypothetical protein
LKIFKEGRGIEIRIFNCYTAIEDAARLEKEEEEEKTVHTAFLCYWGEHVFPITRSKCFELARA